MNDHLCVAGGDWIRNVRPCHRNTNRDGEDPSVAEVGGADLPRHNHNRSRGDPPVVAKAVERKAIEHPYHHDNTSRGTAGLGVATAEEGAEASS